MTSPLQQPETLTTDFLLQVINVIENPIFVKDRQHRWVMLNDAFASFMGYSASALIGQSADLFFESQEAEILRETDELVFNTGITCENEQSFTDAQGINRLISVKKCLLEDGEGNKFVVGTIRDLTQKNLPAAKDIIQHQLTKQALQKSEVKLHKLTANLPGMLYQFVLSPDGSIACPYVSPRSKEVYGLTPEEIQNDPNLIISIVHPDDRQELDQSIAISAQTLQPWKWEGRIILPDGQVKWLYGVSSPELQVDGSIVWDGIIIDIDNRKQIEEALQQAYTELETRVVERTKELQAEIIERQQAEQRLILYKQALESSSDAIAIADADGNHIYQNPAFAQLYECPTIDDFIRYGGATARFTDPTKAEEIWQATVSGQSWIGEVEQKSINGRIIQTFLRSYLLKDSTGKNIGLVGAITDITERKHAESQLREKEQFLRTVFDGSEHLIFSLDVQEDGDLHYSGWNVAAERSSGIKICEVIGKTPEELMGATQGANLRQNYLTCIEAGTPISYEECLTVRGEETWWLTTLNPLQDYRGKTYRIVGTTIEISDRKRVEIQLQQQTKNLETALQELQSAQMQLVQSEKMSSLGQLVAGVAHEINNPVNFIYGNLTHAHNYAQDLLQLVQLYQQYCPENIEAIQELTEAIDLEFLIQDLPQVLNSMKIGAQRIREIVISLRTFSRMDEAEMKEVDIHEGIDSTLMILEHRIKAKPEREAIKVIKEYSNLPLVECYAGQLNQVFMNILANAIDALEESMENGKIMDNPQIFIRTHLIEKNQVTIRIADNGTGISEDVKKRLFDPFFTTKPIGKGTGMGLSISYQIISQKHRGTLECISQLGCGTEFVINIPLRQQ